MVKCGIPIQMLGKIIHERKKYHEKVTRFVGTLHGSRSYVRRL
jgi:hypothetical protein